MSWKALLLALALLPAPALAYQCTRTTSSPTSVTQVWMSRCIPYYVSLNGSIFDSEERLRLVQQSFEVWSKEACTDLVLEYKGRTTETEAFDVSTPEKNYNVIAAIEDDSSSFPDPRLLALTLTRFSVATGEILDADIIFNGTRFRFDEVTDPVACEEGDRAFDLRSVLVHEIGHFIGFDHVADIPEATMFPEAQACELKKRDLHEDDRMGVCEVYEKGRAAKTCTPPDTYTPGGLDPDPFRNQCARESLQLADPGGCSCGASGRAELGLWAVLAAIFAHTRRRGAPRPRR